MIKIHLPLVQRFYRKHVVSEILPDAGSWLLSFHIKIYGDALMFYFRGENTNF